MPQHLGGLCGLTWRGLRCSEEGVQTFSIPKAPCAMFALSDVFVHLYVLVDDLLKDGVIHIPRRPGPSPACSDAEVLTIALTQRVRGVTSENAWLEEVRADWGHYFRYLPHQ